MECCGGCECGDCCGGGEAAGRGEPFGPAVRFDLINAFGESSFGAGTASAERAVSSPSEIDEMEGAADCGVVAGAGAADGNT